MEYWSLVSLPTELFRRACNYLRAVLSTRDTAKMDGAENPPAAVAREKLELLLLPTELLLHICSFLRRKDLAKLASVSALKDIAEDALYASVASQTFALHGAAQSNILATANKALRKMRSRPRSLKLRYNAAHMYISDVPTILDSLFDYSRHGFRMAQLDSCRPFASMRATPLHLAAANGNNEVIPKLIEAGDDVNAELSFHYPWSGFLFAALKDTYTPLFLALLFGHESTAALLLDLGAHGVVEKRCRGLTANLWNQVRLTPYREPPVRTALHCAVAAKMPSIINRLLDEDPSLINAYDYRGLTPLHIAASLYRAPAEAVQSLIDRGADVNAADQVYGHTALHMLALTKNFEQFKRTVDLLLAAGANINARDTAGLSPVQHASWFWSGDRMPLAGAVNAHYLMKKGSEDRCRWCRGCVLQGVL
ncbi:hypothetical protein S40288_01990 [Stachybotrys chartarum IBT 40288]|nr:hypothetical protein S40288_01990 [Stachybotrys chartarum IBT 40288]